MNLNRGSILYTNNQLFNINIYIFSTFKRTTCDNIYKLDLDIRHYLCNFVMYFATFELLTLLLVLLTGKGVGSKDIHSFAILINPLYFNIYTMAIIKSVRGYTPKIGENVFLADNAAVIGNVEIGDNSSIWFGAVLRGDVNSIKIGKNVNIQDGAVLHTLYDKSPKPSTIEIGDNVSVGHNATIHGAKIENNVLVGMGSIILDNVVVGEGSIIAAGAVVTTGTIVEPGSLMAGVPAKKIKEVSPEQSKDMIQRISDNYHLYASWYEE